MKLPFTQIDAFASAPFTGNPAAVMMLDAWPGDAVLQAIAAENNLAETAFLLRDASDASDYELRWFTPTVEVVLCGHATLASGHHLLSQNLLSQNLLSQNLLSQSGGYRVRFRTRRAGVLEVRRAGDGYELDLPAWPMEPASRGDVVALIGGRPVETRWREGGYLMFVYATEAEVRALRPDFPALAALGDLLLIATAPGTDTDIVSRVFVPGGGIDEDPVTGSAHALLTRYWSERLGRATFSAYQASARGGSVTCRLASDRAVLGGRCVTVIEGVFTLAG